jgi:hypothetical protein
MSGSMTGVKNLPRVAEKPQRTLVVITKHYRESALKAALARSLVGAGEQRGLPILPPKRMNQLSRSSDKPVIGRCGGGINVE